MLVAKDDFTAGEKLSLRWNGPRRNIRAINDYMYQLDDLRNGLVGEVLGSFFKIFYDSSQNEEAVMPDVRRSEIGMVVQRRMGFLDTKNGLMVHVRWRGLPDSGDIVK